MLHPRKTSRVASRAAFVAASLLSAITPAACLAQELSWRHDAPVATIAQQPPAETVITADLRLPELATSSILGATLCFAVGFAACLLVVHAMLPSLVHKQCVEIVREYLEFTRRESDVRFVVLDRESHEPLKKPRRVGVPSAEPMAETRYESPHQFRVDKPNVPVRSGQIGQSASHSDEVPDSMLVQIYEQNIHLRDQLREQSRSIKQ